jgi:hypothetical protein
MSRTHLLRLMEATIIDSCRKAAGHAMQYLADEKVYGFWLYHHVFEYCCCTVFTEAGLDAVTRKYAELRDRPEPPTRDDLRWSPCDSPHHLYLPHTFAHVDLLFSTLESQGRPEGIEDTIERMMTRALRATRRNQDLPDSVVMLITEADHNPEMLLVSAEQFCSPEVLESFRTQLGPLDEDYLAAYRERVLKD